jgi:hypothetical protein
MSQNYYSTSNDYPSIIIPIMERVQYFICKELLYPDEDYVNPHPKFILVEQTDDAFRLAAKKFRKTNFTMPFTAYNFGEINVDEERLNVNAKLGLTYSHDVSSYIDAVASILNVPMLSVYNRGHDYMRAWGILNSISVKNKKLTVPCIINGITTSFDVYITMIPSKGPYAYELQEQRRVGDVKTIQHDMTIFFHNPILDTGVAPVDSIEFSLEAYAGTDYRDSVSIDSGISPDTPIVSSSSPVSGVVGFPVVSGVILTFNVGMKEDLTVNNTYVDPLFLFETTWNSDSTILTIDPHEDLTSGTAYTVTIYDDAESGNGVELEEDYSLTFTTA